MSQTTNPILTAPRWLLRSLPINALFDTAIHEQLETLATELPGSVSRMAVVLEQISSGLAYDAAANLASALIWREREAIFTSAEISTRSSLLSFAENHMTSTSAARILRRLAKDAAPTIRKKAQKAASRLQLREVSLPRGRNDAWDTTGWNFGLAEPTAQAIGRHPAGAKHQEAAGVPTLQTVGDLRELLNLKSTAQLGYLLLSTDAKDGPYTKFAIPKRDGGEREICAPKSSLRYAQRGILHHILSKVQPHSAAHGFITGRSTVTNAEPHVGAELVVKFDLTDFFPTIHYYRVLGLFGSFGYWVDEGKFSSQDSSSAVAATLARLCVHTPDSKAWGRARLPQGAPTSPAISNLVCRRLDSRLEGLAASNQGVYTRYADDLTFSFPKDEISLGRFRWWVDQICHQEGFFVNQAKFRVIRNSQRQMVTGIVVNDLLRIPRRDRRRFRAILHNCEKHGVASQARDRDNFSDYLRGFASYIHMVHPEEGRELLERVKQLLGD